MDRCFDESIPEIDLTDDRQPRGVSAAVVEDRPPAFTDEALALRFAERHEPDLRYVAAWGRWLHCDGQRWRFDDTLLAFDLARKVCREAAAVCDNAKIANILASAKTVAAVERLAKADRRLAATIDQWDADVWVLNTPGGVLDLRTGRTRPHRRDDYLTKMTAVAPGGDCPVWRAHLLRIMNGDVDLVAYLQRVFGYALTGNTREHALFFGFGTGANGKTVTVSTTAGVMADYHRTASVETLTGGERVEARFMRQDFFEFQPQLKLLICGNHKPGLTAVDEAIRRRFHLIPFTVTIPSEERDETLPERLKAEWSGILAWMMEGCLAWQRDGLKPPAAVLSATAAYLEGEDLFGQWLADECDAEPGNAWKWEAVGQLFDSWSTYATRAGEKPGSKKAFSQAMQNRGLASSEQGHAKVRAFTGIRLKPRADHA